MNGSVNPLPAPTWFLQEWSSCCLKPRLAGNFDLRPGRRRYGSRDPWSLVAIHSGTLDVVTSGTRKTATAPAQILLPPGRIAEFVVGRSGSQGWSSHFIVVPTPAMENPMHRIDLPAVVPGPIDEAAWLGLLGHFHVATHGPRSPVALMLARPALDLVIARFLLAGFAACDWDRAWSRSKPPDWLEDLASWIYVNALKPRLTLSDIIAQSGMSVSQVMAGFSRYYQQTPMAFLRRQRMHQAVRFLRERIEMPIADVAARCGYRSANLFARHFRQEFSVTPRAWRESAAPVQIETGA
ncbi:hypothetical protein LBMAG53_07900 [Planctomycetota bacterium]|nr:hypothetical protein LBMAG53_07900 [Planctomycetota bacterium]